MRKIYRILFVSFIGLSPFLLLKVHSLLFCAVFSALVFLSLYQVYRIPFEASLRRTILAILVLCGCIFAMHCLDFSAYDLHWKLPPDLLDRMYVLKGIGILSAFVIYRKMQKKKPRHFISEG